jgi:CDP-glucose 4,6-dehydratase
VDQRVSPDLRGRKILVTGATGFIGSALVERLSYLGAHVVEFNRNQRSPYSLAPQVFCGEIDDYQAVSQAISMSECDSVVHLAASAIVRISARDPLSTYRINVMGTATVLEAVRNVGKAVKRVVVASSDKAYGDHDVLPYTENHDLRPSNIYDASKAAMDLCAQAYAKNHDMPIVVTRCSNVYGPGDKNTSRLVPNTIIRLLDGRLPQIYSDVMEMEREFIYIDDVVDAYVRLLVANENIFDGRPYNIGGAGPMKIRELVRMMAEKIDGADPDEFKIVHREMGFDEIMCQHIDARALQDATGWRRRIDIHEGLSRTIAHYAEVRDLA